jgi:hypothetical protein
MPAEFDAWSTVSNRFRQWRDAGVFERTGRDVEWDTEREARRSIRRRQKLRLTATLNGRSRGGQTSKVHLAGDRECRPPAFVLTAGQAADSPQFLPVLKKIRSGGLSGRLPHPAGRGRRGQGDSSCGNRAHLRRRGIKAVIPEKRDQAANRKKKGSWGRPVRHDTDLHTRRGTPSSACSTSSRHGGASPPGTTRARRATSLVSNRAPR